MKKVFIILIIFIIVICLIFFIKNNYKTKNIGNNINKSADNLKEYILNISSYRANIEVTVKSNKNENKYVIKQEYINPNIAKQEIIEPSSISGLKTIYDGENLKIENTNLSLTKIIDKYNYIPTNTLWLTSFINEYKHSNISDCKETQDELIMKVSYIENNCNMEKELYIDKKTSKPTKMTIKDINKNTAIYIIYNEINFNNIIKEDILA